MDIDLTARLEGQKALLKQAHEAKVEMERIKKEEKERQFLEKYETYIRRIIGEIMDVADKNAQLGKSMTVVGVVYTFGVGFTSSQCECWKRIINILERTYSVDSVGSRDYDIAFGPMVQTTKADVNRKYTFAINLP